MVLFLVILLILCLSLALSYFSIQNDLKKGKHIEEVKKNLEKERVIFYAPHHQEKEM